jgi:GT2 family glycosyltransferase
MLDRGYPESACSKLSILAVIVLYKQQLSESATFQTLMASMRGFDSQSLPFRVFIYDNTPGAANPGSLPENVCYEAAGRNTGLAVAYNRALELAQELGVSWLLLLDQDTVLPPDFLESLCRGLEQWQSNAEVVAVVPIVRSGSVVVSPKRVGFFGLKPMGNAPYGVFETEIMAINSGIVVRCDFLRSIGGFNRAYWLDYLDHWLFRQIYKHGKRAAVSGCILEHDLSVRDYRHNIDLQRYRSILAGESAFMTSQKPKSQIPFYLLRLAARSIKMFMHGQPDLALFTLKAIVRIALHPLRSLEENPR